MPSSQGQGVKISPSNQRLQNMKTELDKTKTLLANMNAKGCNLKSQRLVEERKGKLLDLARVLESQIEQVKQLMNGFDKDH